MRVVRAIFVAIVALGFMLPGALSSQAAPSRDASRFTFHVSEPHFVFQNQPTVRMTAKAGFGDDGAYVIGNWFPVRVELDNPSGAPDRRVRVEVNLSADYGGGSAEQVGVYARDVDLPSPSRKQVTLYAYAGGFNRSVEVRLVEGGSIIARSSVSIDPQESFNNAIVGVVSSDSSLLNVYEGEHVGDPQMPVGSSLYGGIVPGTVEAARATIAHIALDDIPPLTTGLDGLGVLFFDDVDTAALSQEQRDSIAAWVARGGTLVVSMRPGGANTMEGFTDILPVSASGTRTLNSLKGLSDLVATPLEASGSYIVPDARLRDDIMGAPRMLAAQDGVTLAAMRDLGQGQVVYLALSPGAEPLRGWDGTVPLVKRLLAEHPVMSGYSGMGYSGYMPPGQLFETYGTIFDLPGLDLPEPLLLAAFMFIYIILIGPINYIVLKRMRRAELAWVTIPAMVAVFAVLAYVIGLQSKGGELLTIRANVIRTTPDLERAEAEQYLGIFSPIRRTYRLQVGGDATASEINPYGYSVGGGSGGAKPPVILASGSTTTIEDVNVNTWSLRSFMAKSTVQAQSPLEANLRLGDNEIEGTVRNRSENALQDVALIRGRAVKHIGYLAPGQEQRVSLDLSSSPFNSTSPVSLLPLPPGVVDPSSGGGYYGGPSGNSNSNEQRDYNRRVQLLSTALQPMLNEEKPDDFTVIAVAWGPPPPSDFLVLDRSTRTEDLNVWTSLLQVAGGQGDSQSLVTNGALPAMQYMPSDNAAWQPFDVTNVRLNPYTTVHYRLPQGTQPDSLTLEYELRSGIPGNPVQVLALNTNTGTWDNLLQLENDQGEGSLPISNPQDYTGVGGQVTLRLTQAEGEAATSVMFNKFTLSLNDTQNSAR